MTRSYSSVAVSTHLSANIDDTVTSFSIVDPSGWPTANFTLRIDNEIMLVGTRTGAALSSITRAYSGSAKAAHTTDADVLHVTVAEDYDGLWKVAGNTAVDAYPTTGDGGKTYVYNETSGKFELQFASGGVGDQFIDFVLNETTRTLTTDSTWEDVSGTSITWTAVPGTFEVTVTFQWMFASSNWLQHQVRLLLDGATTNVKPAVWMPYKENATGVHPEITSTVVFVLDSISQGSHTIKLQSYDGSSSQDRTFTRTLVTLKGPVTSGGGAGTAPGWVSALAARDDTATSDDDEFDDDIVDASWTHLQTSGTPTVTEKRGVLSILTGVQSSGDCNAFLKPIASGTNVVVETAFRAFQEYSNYLMVGPVFSTGVLTTSNVIWQMNYFAGNVPVLDIRSGTFANVGTDHGSPGSTGPIYVPLSHWYQRFEYDSTNGFRQWWSPDSVSWTQLGGGWVANPLGSAPTHMGIGYSTWGGSERIVSFEYFRVNPA